MATEAQRMRRKRARERRKARAAAGLRPQAKPAAKAGFVKRQPVIVQSAVQAGYAKAANQVRKKYTSDLALAMALPCEHPDTRFPTVDMPRTATLLTRDQFALSTANVAPPGWNATNTVAFFYGQANRLAVVWSGTALPGYNANMEFATGGATWKLGEGGQYSVSTDDKNFIDEKWWDLTTVFNTTGTPHGYTVPIGVSNGVPYVFLNVGDSVGTIGANYQCTGGPMTSLQVLIDVYRWTPAGPVLASGNPFGLNGGSFGATTWQLLANSFNPTDTVPGWFAFKLRQVVSAGPVGCTFESPNLIMYVTGAASAGYRLIGAADMDPLNGGDANISSQVRVNAASMLVTNTSSQLNMQGTILAARMSAQDPFLITEKSLSKIAERYYGSAAKGTYTFKEFSVADEDFSTNNETSGTGRIGLTFDLDYRGFIHVVQITNANVATNPNTFMITLDTALEFKTDIMRYNRGVASQHYDALIEARRIVNGRPEWFYENPLHMMDVYNFIKKGLRTVGRGLSVAAPYMAKAAGAVDPVHAQGYDVLAKLLSRLGT